MSSTTAERTSSAGLFKNFAGKAFDHAAKHNIRNIRDSVAKAARTVTGTPRVVDLGCWDGEATVAMAPKGAELFGTEISEDAGLQAKQRGVEAVQADLNYDTPFASDSFDVAMSNQVIEHLSDTDMFVAEAFRILKPGGTAVISTENMSSWHNLTALILGWQAFSLTNISSKSGGVGNPMALTRDWDPFDKGWQHLRIFSHRGLKELLEIHGFTNVRVLGAGYYPLPTRVANLDPRHAAFITAVGTKPA